MRRWYSSRGARRGLVLSAMISALWLSWAVGYVQGAKRLPPPSSRPTHTTTVDVKGGTMDDVGVARLSWIAHSNVT